MFRRVGVWLFLCIEGMSSVSNVAPYYCPKRFYSGWYWWCEMAKWREEPVTCLRGLSSEKLESELRWHFISQVRFFLPSSPFLPPPCLCRSEMQRSLCWSVPPVVHWPPAFSFFPPSPNAVLPWHMTLTQTGLYHGFSLLNALKRSGFLQVSNLFCTPFGCFPQV